MSRVEEELYAAVNNCDVELTKFLLKQGVSVNTLVHSGRTILGRAAQIGNSEIIQLLLEAENCLPPGYFSNDEDINPQDTKTPLPEEELLSWIPLKENDNQLDFRGGSSFSSGNYERREEIGPQSSYCWESPYEIGLGLFHSLRRYTFHKRQCDVNLPDFYDRMPIHYAAETGKVAVVAQLLKAGSRVNVSDSDNITPLHLSVSRGHEEVVEMLLKAGSRVNCKTSDKSSALHIAASRGFPNIVAILLQFGAKIEILDASERTPLVLAVSRANYDVVELLVKHGAKVNVEEIHGYTPLSEAVWQKNCELVRLLLEAGAKVTGPHYLLHYSVLHHSLSLCQLLLNFGAFVNIRDDSGDTPLHIAVRSAQVDIVTELLKHGSSAILPNGVSGQTAIHEAVESISELELSSFKVILQLLLENRARLNSESYTPGDTPLYRSILLDKFLFAEELLRSGSDPNIGNVYSCTIDNLCLAKRKNHFRTVQLLVYAGFDLNQTSWLEILPSPYPHSYSISSIKGWLIYMKSNPMNLTELCRIVIRQTMKENVVSKVNKLEVPLRLKNFLLFQDIAIVKEDPASKANAENANVLQR